MPRFFRYNNHLLWLVVLLSVGLLAYLLLNCTAFLTATSGAANPAARRMRMAAAAAAATKRQPPETSAKRVRFELPPPPSPPPSPQHVFMDLARQDYLKDPHVGRVVFRLYPEHAPRTCANFAQLCADRKYVDTPFHRIIKDFMLQGGDVVNQDGTGTFSIYGGEGSTFDDEPFVLKHTEAGMLSMANSGANTNGSQFFITTHPTPHLDGKHVVFGQVVQGMEFVSDLEREMTDTGDRPLRKCYVANCGVLGGGGDGVGDDAESGHSLSSAAANDDAYGQANYSPATSSAAPPLLAHHDDHQDHTDHSLNAGVTEPEPSPFSL
jgi:cyclophilin family peptidyl-prolyl cis-trans isomerase